MIDRISANHATEEAAVGSATVPKLLLTAHEAAQALGISEKSLWNYSKPRGPIPTVKIGAAVRYDPRALADWIAAQQQNQ